MIKQQKTPSKSCSLSFLERIAASNYCADNGQEYVPSEVDSLIEDKKTNRLGKKIKKNIHDEDTANFDMKVFIKSLKRHGLQFLSEETKQAIIRDIRPTVVKLSINF